MATHKEVIGIILSGGTTTEATCQLLESAEKGNVKEGMLVLIESEERKLLARIAQIIPYNAFYTEGDAWSEARRKGYPIPEEVARKYEICKLDLLIEIPRLEIRSPPEPGDFVLKIDPKQHLKEIFGVSPGDPRYIWIGTLSGYERSSLPVPLYVENIPMHIAIFGVTGSGKSFTTGALIERLTEIPINNNVVSYPMIIIDAHGDYTDYANYIANGNKLGSAKWVKRYVFPRALMERINLRVMKNVKPIGINLDLINCRELAEIIILYYKGTLEGAELQITGLERLFEYMLEDKGYSGIQSLFINYFDELKKELEKIAEEMGIAHQTKVAIFRALDSFKVIEEKHKLLSTDSELKKFDFIDNITCEGGIAIFDFSADGAPGVDLKTKQFVMTYLATLLFDHFTQYKTKKEDRYLLLIIEEAQNFCPDKSYPISFSLAHTKLSAIATQGRKFGLSLCLISQRPSFVDRIILSMCNTFFIHRVSPEDVNFVRSICGGLPLSLASRLTTMGRGDVIITGQMLSVPFPLLVHILEGDRKIKHTIGKTNVCERLAELRGFS
ncbi:MAG: ATP-binding protein [Candidatus Methanomethylicia archaeon]|nr:ATP-binding protein [Candidatus Methanomethylicia archaeon]